MFEQILLGLWPPLLVAVPLLAIAWLPRRLSAASAHRRTWSVGGALAGGMLAAFVALQQGFPLPPMTATKWLIWSVVLGGLLAMVDAFRRLPTVAWWATVTVFASASSWLGLQRLAENQWGPLESAAHIGGTAVLAVAVTVLFAAPATKQAGPLVPVLLTMVFGTAGHVLGQGGSALLGQLAGAVTSMLGACAVVAAYNPAFRLQRGPAFVLGLLLAGLLVQGWLLAEVAVFPLALVAAATLALRVEPLVQSRGWAVRTGVVLATAAIPLAVAAIIVTLDAAEDPYGY